MAVSSSSSRRPFSQKFLNPSWLAGLISVGFHGAMFAAGPTFPNLGLNHLVEPELEAENRNVPLVELTEAEQARLPDFSGSLYNFDSFDDLEPLTPLFEDDETLSSGRGTDETFSQNTPSAVPRSRPTPPPSYRIPFGITSLEPRPRNNNPRSPLPQPRTQPSQPQPNSATAPQTAANSSAPANGDDAASTPNTGTAADLAPLPGRTSATPQSSADIARGSNPTEVMTLEERLRAYTYDVAATESAAVEARFNDWITAGRTFAEELDIAPDFVVPDFLTAADPGTEDTKPESPAAAEMAEAPETAAELAEGDTDQVVREPIELPIDHEQRICLAKEPQKGLIGAWVSPEGELLGEPEIIRSTGYAGLNQQAMERIRTLDFSAVDRFTGYQFEVIVNYDPENCVNFGRTLPNPSDEDVARDRENDDTTDKTPPKDHNSAAPSAPVNANDEMESVDVEAESSHPAANGEALEPSRESSTDDAASEASP